MTLPTSQLLPWYEAYPGLTLFAFTIFTLTTMFACASANDGHLWWVRLKQCIFETYTREEQ
jgi:hypothetical protein